MTRPARFALAVIVVLVGLIAVVIVRDGERLREARKLGTRAEIEDFARRNGAKVGVVRHWMENTVYIVQFKCPVLEFIAREIRWGPEVPGGFQSKITFFNEW